MCINFKCFRSTRVAINLVLFPNLAGAAVFLVPAVLICILNLHRIVSVFGMKYKIYLLNMSDIGEFYPRINIRCLRNNVAAEVLSASP